MMTDHEMKTLVNQYLHHPKVIETYQKFKAIDTDPAYPSMIYFGINFENDVIVSFKVYFAIYKKLNDEDIKQFLPDISDFKKYYHLWQASKIRSEEHTGCTFEIKFKRSHEPTYGFHYRLDPTPEAYDLIGKPELLSFDITEENTRPGINYEYEPGRTLRKKYYYIKSPENKKRMAERFGYNYIIHAAFIEYTESNDFAKINIWNPNYTPYTLNRAPIFSEKEQNMIDFFRKEYGLINISDGIYENHHIKATYFFSLPGDAEFPFEDPQNLKVDTLKLFYS